MKIVAGCLFGLAIVWSLLQLIAASGLLPPAGADLGGLPGEAAPSTSVELVRHAYADCPLMRALIARYNAGERILSVSVLEAAAHCEGRSLQP